MKNLEPKQLGRYRILEELGRGAMGVVHKAEDASLGRVVAIKAVELSPNAADSKEYEARFYQEAKAAGSLNHPGIISIYDTGREGDWAYIAMELLDGIELRKLIEGERLPLGRVLDIAAQVANALEYAHQRGVVHRDIKPANIMVLPGGQVKIMDFGIARTRASAVETQVGVVLGSPKYMSPEQVIGKRVDHRSDIFSLGIMLFEMVAGIAPYTGNDIAEVMYAVVNWREMRPSQFNPAAPELLDLIVAKALQKDVASRYQSAGEFAADLAICRASLDENVARPVSVGDATVPLGTNALARTPTGVSTPPRAFGNATGVGSPAGAREDAATVPLAGIGAPPTDRAQLLFSRRFNSAPALLRLAQPSADDMKILSKITPPASRLSGVFGGTRNIGALVMIATAILGALAIALN
jgi:eukaryotic-like serine/threonine-protein kinase